MVNIGLIAVILMAAQGGVENAPPRVKLPDGSLVGKEILLLKGKSVMLSTDKAVVWTAEPAGVVEIKATDGGKTAVTALRDAFDESDGHEPRATVSVCDGQDCATFLVTCLADLAGTWKLSLVGKWLGLINHSEEREPVFVQNGRDITFEDKPKDAKPPYKVIRLWIYGRGLQLKDGGGALKKFGGKLKDRSSGEGEFDSVPGFRGKWTATKK